LGVTPSTGSSAPIEQLATEHRVIEQAAAGMNVLAARLDAGSDVPAVLLTRLVEFLRVFADQCHHGKEEASLFPVLEAQGVPSTGCPLGGLLGEHRKGRQLVDELAHSAEAYAAGGDGARDRVAASLRALQDLYASHIWKEDNLLFPLAGRMLAPAEASRLELAFRQVEEAIGDERLRALRDFAARLQDDARS
jgi:hemerythrin-like domain-containing protein